MRERTIPNYLEAKTKKDLRVLMGRIQSKTRLNIHFYDFQFAQSKWTCWYDIPLSHELAEALSGEAQD